MDFKFMSEADKSTRVIHRALGKLHGFEPQKVFTDLAKRGSDTKVEFYMAGPPCQPWTSLVNGAGVEDEAGRGTVMYHVVHYLRTAKPKAFILENVVGLCSKHLPDMAAILEALENPEELPGYQASWKKVNALQNCCPQSRPRIYVVGIRNDCCIHTFTWPQPLPLVPPLDMFLDSKPNDHPPKFNATEERNYSMWKKKLRKIGINLESTTFMMDLQAGKNFGQCTKDHCPCLTKARGKSVFFYFLSEPQHQHL